MKNLNVLFIALLMLFASCSNDDDSVEEVDLTGTWEVSEVEFEGEATIEYEGFPITIPLTGFGKNMDAQVIITENPNLVNSTGSFTAEITGSFFGQTETHDVPVDFSEYHQNSSWYINGETLVLTRTDGVVINLQITTLTDTKVVLVGVETFTYEGEDVELDTTYTLIR